MLDLHCEVLDDEGRSGVRLGLGFGDSRDGRGHALEVDVFYPGVAFDELVEGEVVVDGDRAVFLGLVGLLGQFEFLGHRLPFVRCGIFPVFEFIEVPLEIFGKERVVLHPPIRQSVDFQHLVEDLL